MCAETNQTGAAETRDAGAATTTAAMGDETTASGAGRAGVPPGPQAGGPAAGGVMETVALPTQALPTLSESYAVRAQRLDYILQQANTLDLLCQRIAEGETVKEIARAWDVPHGRLSGWLLADRTRMECYYRAQELHAHTLVEEAVGIADAASPDDKAGVLKARLQVDVRFRTAAHHASRRYGEQGVKNGGTKVNVIVQRNAAPCPPVAIEMQHDTN